MHFCSVHTHWLWDVCLNIMYTDTPISSSSKSAGLWFVWVTVVGARETLWFIPCRVIFLVVNMGTSHIPALWPPTSVSSVRTLNMCTAWLPACLWPTDWFSHLRASSDSCCLDLHVSGTHISDHCILYQTARRYCKCWVKYDRWPWCDPIRLGYYIMKALSQKPWSSL